MQQNFLHFFGIIIKWLRQHYKKLLVGAGALFGAWLLFALILGVAYQHRHRNDPLVTGVSFSQKYAEELGNDWRANYTALLDDAGFRQFRLMSYWDEIEPTPGNFDFTDLDWQMDQAAQRGAKVSLAIGKRQPRWPECHQPGWVDDLAPAEQDQRLLAFLSAVITHYKDHPALQSYQLENEVANRLFSPHCDKFNRARLQAEFTTVKKIDPHHPVIINVSNQSGVPVRGPIGDGVGFSIYKKAYAKIGPFAYYWSFGYVPTLWHSYRAGLTELLHPGKTTFVHELQAEPWGPAATKDLSFDEQLRSISTETIRQNVTYAQETGMHTVYLWGGEWWYWRKTTFNDSSFWNAAADIVKSRTQ